MLLTSAAGVAFATPEMDTYPAPIEEYSFLPTIDAQTAPPDWKAGNDTTGNFGEDFAPTARWATHVQTRTLTFHAPGGWASIDGSGGVINGHWVDIPYGWNGTVGDTQITQDVEIGANWSSITWPIAENVAAERWHTPSIPVKPTGTLSATCNTFWAVEWTVETRTLTIDAGPDGFWAEIPPGWFGIPTGTQITRIAREMKIGSNWSSITWPRLSSIITRPGVLVESMYPLSMPTGVLTETCNTSWVILYRVLATHTLTIDAGVNGTWATVPAGWVAGSDVSYITQTVIGGTAWDSIVFPAPTEVGAFRHTGWTPVRPATGNIGADFSTTAIWERLPVSHRITLRAQHPVWTRSAPAGWSSSRDGTYIFRYVPDGTPWNTIFMPQTVPTMPTRNGYIFMGWSPPIPTTGHVTAPFTSTAMWTVVTPTMRQVRFNDNFSWWTARTGVTRVTDTTALPSGDVTLHAQWVTSAQWVANARWVADAR